MFVLYIKNPEHGLYSEYIFTDYIITICMSTQSTVRPNSHSKQSVPQRKLCLTSFDVYLDWIGHSPCNDGGVFAMLNVKLTSQPW